MGFAIACVVAALGTWGVVAVVRQLRRPETVDRDGRILLADTWTNRRDVVTGYHARVRLEASGFSLPHTTWNDEWVSTIRAAREHMENPQWHAAYIVRRRRAAKLPELVLPPDLSDLRK